MRRIEVRPRASGWVVRVEDEDGDAFQYAYSSEKQARYFAAVYRLQRECLRLEERLSAAAPRGRGRRPARASAHAPA
jgi:hypothetical protein